MHPTWELNWGICIYPHLKLFCQL